MRHLFIPLGILAITLLLTLSAGCGSSGNSGNALRGDFIMNFSDMTPHLGQNLYLKVVDTTNGGMVPVAIMTPRQVTSDDFTVTLPNIMLPSRTYNIDFWADVNGNGTLDGTPSGSPAGVDHAWRMTANGNANAVVINWVHDTNFTDIRPF